MTTFDTLIEKYPKNEALKQFIPFKSFIKIEPSEPVICNMHGVYITFIAWYRQKT